MKNVLNFLIAVITTVSFVACSKEEVKLDNVQYYNYNTGEISAEQPDYVDNIPKFHPENQESFVNFPPTEDCGTGRFRSELTCYRGQAIFYPFQDGCSESFHSVKRARIILNGDTATYTWAFSGIRIAGVTDGVMVLDLPNTQTVSDRSYFDCLDALTDVKNNHSRIYLWNGASNFNGSCTYYLEAMTENVPPGTILEFDLILMIRNIGYLQTLVTDEELCYVNPGYNAYSPKHKLDEN